MFPFTISPPTFLLPSTLSFLFIYQLATGIGLTCDQHPGYHTAITPVLVHSWEFPHDNVLMANYHPRNYYHRYAPIANPADRRYDHLDLFWMAKARGSGPDYARLFLHRPAKVYIVLQIMSVLSAATATPTLDGWNNIGFVKLVKGSNRIKFGVHQQEQYFIPRAGYVFERDFESVVELPYKEYVIQNLQGLRTTGDYVVLLAEADGASPTRPWQPKGVTEVIKPNRRCPDQLHDLWVTPNTDDEDEDTRGIMWKTWHPQWDPCYWCAYDHEHGSSPQHLMGYAPKFGYTAYKRNRESESHEGFKGYVFRAEDYFVYFSVHAQTSSLRRIDLSRHTVIIAITHAETKELVAELTHKADFGFLAAQNPSNGFTPLSPEDEEIRNYQKTYGVSAKRRSVNVIDINNLDPRFSYRLPESKTLLGVYEEWATSTLCSGGKKYSGSITADIILSASGIKSQEEKDVKVNLGSWRNGNFIRSTGSARQLKFTRGGFVISEKSCVFELSKISGGMSKEGVFYTDAYGESLVNGPSADTLRQFIKPGLKVHLSGLYGATDSWLGLHKQGHFGFMVNYGYGLDPDKN